MLNTFNTLDWIIIGLYCVGIISLAAYVSRNKSGNEKSAEDYFLAGRSLPWWAIGASLIAANISAEQIIGMSGQGYFVGMAIAVWELTAAIALIIMAKYFLPLFLEKKIYTMPQFLEQRFDKRVSLVLSIFWLIVYIFINLTSVLWLGSLAINALTGLDFFYGLLLLAMFSLAYSLSGGLKAVAMTDGVQVILLIFGGLAVSFIALNTISESSGVIEGLKIVMSEMPEKFDMVLSSDNESYFDLPGIWILLGLGVWIGHFFYWGFNQYITQRALAAKDIKEAQKGVMFAAYIKLLMPIVIVLPGICAAMLFPVLEKSDQAYPTMMSLLPNGLLGLTFAALIAAIVSSLASMSNSISTIFTMDIYKHFKNNDVTQSNLIQVGQITVIISLLIATIVAMPLLGSFESIFQYIQNFTGYFSPGIVVVFLVALFWKKATSLSVMAAALISLIASIFLSINYPDLPFIHRMTIVFILSALGCLGTSYLQGYKDQDKAIDLSAINFSTSKAFNLNTIIIMYALVCIYVAFA
jgi:SSS family solute:Na+ symporter